MKPPPFKDPRSGQDDYALKMAVNAELDVFQMYYLVDAALKEDVGLGDITARALFGRDELTDGAQAGPEVTARIFAKQDGVVCGMALIAMTFKLSNDKLAFEQHIQDGTFVKSGAELCTIRGHAAPILQAERTALNFFGRLAGIATFTRRFVDAVEGTNAVILDTRKTIPGWRLFEKYAARTGGAVNHRLGLYHEHMIKENHLRATGHSVHDAVEAVRKAHPRPAEGEPRGPQFITAEVETLDQLREVLDAGADNVLLDNVTPELLVEAVKVRDAFVKANPDVPSPKLEASGGVTLENVRIFAETGVERISIGALTHSAPGFDASLLIDPVGGAACNQ